MSRSLRYSQIFQGKNSRKIPPIDFKRSEISDIVALVRNFLCSCRVWYIENFCTGNYFHIDTGTSLVPVFGKFNKQNKGKARLFYFPYFFL